MKLWLLRPVDGLKGGDNPWDPWYDKAFGFVIRAENESEARRFAHNNAGDENRGEFLSEKIAGTKEPWLDPKYSTCEPLEHDNGEDGGVVMCDFASA